MSTILPPPPTPLPLPTAAPAPVVTVPSPPAALAELAAGTNVKAEVVTLLARNLAEVETDIGNFQIRTQIALRVGAELDLQLLKAGQQVQLALRGIDGHALPGQAASGAGSGAAQASLTPGTASATTQSAQTSSSEFANALQRNTAAQATLAAKPGPLAVGTTLNATLISRPPGADQPANSPAASTAQHPTATSPSAPAYAPSTTVVQNLQRQDAAGTRVELRVLSIVTPTSTSGERGATAVGAPASMPPLLSGTVTAFTPTGKPVVDTPTGLLALETDADVRIGHKLTFAIVPPAPRTDQSAAGFLDTFVQKKSWPSLEQAITFLAQRAHETGAPGGGSPSSAAQNLPIPQPNSQLAHALIAATNALADGDIRAWLGDVAAALEQDQPALFQRLSDEFAQLARLASEPRTDDWRTALLPFFAGANMEPVQMHLRGEKQPKGEKKKDDGGSRFIIDLTLSNLGRFQMDGFLKERGEAKSFDLIVRTDAALPQRMRYDINRIFTDFTEVAGLKGGIAFQAHGQFVEVPLPSSLNRDGGVVV